MQQTTSGLLTADLSDDTEFRDDVTESPVTSSPTDRCLAWFPTSTRNVLVYRDGDVIVAGDQSETSFNRLLQIYATTFRNIYTFSPGNHKVTR